MALEIVQNWFSPDAKDPGGFHYFFYRFASLKSPTFEVSRGYDWAMYVRWNQRMTNGSLARECFALEEGAWPVKTDVHRAFDSASVHLVGLAEERREHVMQAKSIFLFSHPQEI